MFVKTALATLGLLIKLDWITPMGYTPFWHPKEHVVQLLAFSEL